MPTMSKTPTTASSPAAVVCAMPWSCAAGTKCVPISPLVVAPQIAKPATSAQNVRVRATPSRSASTASRPAPGRAGLRALVGLERRASASRVGSLGAVRRDAAVRGWSRSTSSTSGTTASAAAAMTSDAARHPACAATTATTGRKISWPVALPAVRMPVTSPRLPHEPALRDGGGEHQRHRPGAQPDQHAPGQHQLPARAARRRSAPDPAAISSSAHAVTRRMPNRSISAAANGAVSPNSTRLTPTASDRVAAAPAELVLQRHHQHAGRGPEAGRAEQRHEGDARRPARRGGSGAGTRVSGGHRRLSGRGLETPTLAA